LAYHEGFKHLAVGHNDGCVSIREISGLEEADGTTLVSLDNLIARMSHPKEWIEIM